MNNQIFEYKNVSQIQVSHYGAIQLENPILPLKSTYGDVSICFIVNASYRIKFAVKSRKANQAFYLTYIVLYRS